MKTELKVSQKIPRSCMTNLQEVELLCESHDYYNYSEAATIKDLINVYDLTEQEAIAAIEKYKAYNRTFNWKNEND